MSLPDKLKVSKKFVSRFMENKVDGFIKVEKQPRIYRIDDPAHNVKYRHMPNVPGTEYVAIMPVLVNEKGKHNEKYFFTAIDAQGNLIDKNCYSITDKQMKNIEDHCTLVYPTTHPDMADNVIAMPTGITNKTPPKYRHTQTAAHR